MVSRPKKGTGSFADIYIQARIKLRNHELRNFHSSPMECSTQDEDMGGHLSSVYSTRPMNVIPCVCNLTKEKCCVIMFAFSTSV
jgi:hypothetical protein